MDFPKQYVNLSDPRLGTHLQTICDETFAFIQSTAARVGIVFPMATFQLPFDMLDEDVENRLRGAIADSIVTLLNMETPKV